MVGKRLSRTVGAVVAIAIGAGLFLGVWALWCAAAEEASSRSSRPPSRASATKQAGGETSDTAHLEAKLDEILATQQAILSKFDAIMEELRIIKVRSTLRSGS